MNQREAADGAVEGAVEGVLIPTAWGPAGEVLDVGLMTFDEHEYRIDAAAARDHGLRQHLRKHVRVSAVIRGDRVIALKRFEVLGRGRPNARTGP